MSGAVLGAIGAFSTALLPPSLGWPTLLVAAFVILGFQLAGRTLRLPQNKRAVPQSIIPRSHIEGPLQFGFEMGTGVRTFIPSSVPHVLALSVLLVGGLVPGIVAGIGFGCGRSLVPICRARYRPPRDWDNVLLRRLKLLDATCIIAFMTTLATLAINSIF